MNDRNPDSFSGPWDGKSWDGGGAVEEPRRFRRALPLVQGELQPPAQQQAQPQPQPQQEQQLSALPALSEDRPFRRDTPALVKEPPEPLQLPQNDFTLPERKKRRWPIIIAIIIVLMLAGGGAVYFMMYQSAAQQDSQRRETYRTLDRSIALIQETDAVIVRIDTATSEQVTSEAVPQLQALLELIPSTQTSLESAVATATEAKEGFTDKDDRALAQHVLDAATHRQTLLKEGAVLIEKDIAAITSLTLFQEAWACLIEADNGMREAAEKSTPGSPEQIQEALDLNRAASEKLDQAQTKLTEAQTAFPQTDFTTISTYIALKKESIDLALAADEALLRGDIAETQTLNESFTKKDEEAVAQAAKIPQEPASLITTAYDTVTAEAHERYQQARSAAAEADAFIREYVGIGS